MIVSYLPLASSDASNGSVGFCPPPRAVDREVGSLGGCKLVLKVPDVVEGFVLKPVGEGLSVGSASSIPCGSVAGFKRNMSPPRREHTSRGFSTWLILPVVICLSQRLSHACPS